MPLAYHARATSVAIDSEIHRPRGMIHQQGSDSFVFQESQKMDYEAELGIFVSRPLPVGKTITANEAENHIFGFVILNDWSARDVQSSEMTPLGPFNGKAFGTSISPWVVTIEALQTARSKSHSADLRIWGSTGAPHLRHEKEEATWDIDLEVSVLSFAALSLLLVIFYVPETLFPRSTAQLGGIVYVTDAYGTYHTFASPEEALAAGFDVAQGETYTNATNEVSYRRQFAPISVQKSPLFKFLNAYKETFTCLLIPGVFWALLFTSFVFGGIVALNLTYAARLELEPWHFSPSTVGTVQAGAAIGAALGLAVGEMAEPISRFFTRRNGGNREPEHVLPNFIVPSTMTFLGLALYGVMAGHPHQYSWVGVHVAFGLFYFGFCGISALSGVWLGELLPQMSGPAIVLVCGERNAVSFGYSSSFPSWIEQIGFMQTYHVWWDHPRSWVLVDSVVFGQQADPQGHVWDFLDALMVGERASAVDGC
ncbi:hypothetical protein ACHAQH_007197 [Verticillium albo-atrum]